MTLSATATHGATAQGNSEGIKATQGGAGTVPAWSQARLQFAAPAGIAQLTPEHHLIATGKNLAIATGHDTNLIAQGHHSLAVKDGLALFTVGKASNKQKPNQETGIHLHAASGQVSLQSQSGKTTAAADKKVTIASTTGKLTASAKQKILATAQGAYLKIEGGNIELHAPGKVEFKASKKDWTGPKSAAVELPSSPSAGDLNLAPANVTEKTDYSQRLNVAPPGETLSIAVQRLDGSYKKIGECCMPSSDGVLTAVSPNVVLETRTEKHEGQPGKAEEHIPKPEQGDLGDLSTASKEAGPAETAQPAGEAEAKQPETPKPADNGKPVTPKPATKPKTRAKPPEANRLRPNSRPTSRPNTSPARKKSNPNWKKGVTRTAIPWR